MLWKETDHTAPAEAPGRYQITIVAPEAIRHTGATALAEPIRAQLPEPLLIEVPVVRLQGHPVEPTEAQLRQGLQVETTEVAPAALQPDHRVVPIEVLAAPAVPVVALEVLAVLLQDLRHPVVEVAEGATKKHGPLFQ